jgi:hypothetical protein
VAGASPAWMIHGDFPPTTVSTCALKYPTIPTRPISAEVGIQFVAGDRGGAGDNAAFGSRFHSVPFGSVHAVDLPHDPRSVPLNRPKCLKTLGVPYEIRTRVTAVKETLKGPPVSMDATIID